MVERGRGDRQEIWRADWGQPRPTLPVLSWDPFHQLESWRGRHRVHLCSLGLGNAPYLDGGRSHLASLVKIQGEDLGVAGGTAIHNGGAVPKGFQEGGQSLPLLHCRTQSQGTSGNPGTAHPQGLGSRMSQTTTVQGLGLGSYSGGKRQHLSGSFSCPHTPAPSISCCPPYLRTPWSHRCPRW